MFPKMLVPPKSSIFIGFSIINHPFWGSPIFGNTHTCFPHAKNNKNKELPGLPRLCNGSLGSPSLNRKVPCPFRKRIVFQPSFYPLESGWPNHAPRYTRPKSFQKVCDFFPIVHTNCLVWFLWIKALIKSTSRPEHCIVWKMHTSMASEENVICNMWFQYTFYYMYPIVRNVHVMQRKL